MSKYALEILTNDFLLSNIEINGLMRDLDLNGLMRGLDNGLTTIKEVRPKIEKLCAEMWEKRDSLLSKWQQRIDDATANFDAIEKANENSCFILELLSKLDD